MSPWATTLDGQPTLVVCMIGKALSQKVRPCPISSSTSTAAMAPPRPLRCSRCRRRAASRTPPGSRSSRWCSTSRTPAAAPSRSRAALGRAGADRVLFCEAPGLGAPPLDVTHGRALFTAVERVPPIVVLFPTGGPGEELGPPLAMRLGRGLRAGGRRRAVRGGRAAGRRGRSHQPAPLARRPLRLPAAGSGRDRTTGGGDPGRARRARARMAPPTSTSRSSPVRRRRTEPRSSELGSEPDELDAVTQARGLVILAPDLAPEIGARLRAGAPAGVAVVDGGAAARGLSTASPELVLEVGYAELDLELGVSPRAPIGLVRIDDGGGPGRRRPRRRRRTARPTAPSCIPIWSGTSMSLHPALRRAIPGRS